MASQTGGVCHAYANIVQCGEGECESVGPAPAAGVVPPGWAAWPRSSFRRRDGAQPGQEEKFRAEREAAAAVGNEPPAGNALLTLHNGVPVVDGGEPWQPEEEPMSPETDPEGPREAPTTFRRAENADDLRLSAEAVAFLSSLSEPVRPYRLAVRFPRIANNLAKLWRQPGVMDRYIDELLIDTRGNRQGFPLKILTEMITLKEHHQTAAFPLRTDVRDNRTDGERNR